MTDILIIGGGLNGTALAIALARTGHSVKLLDNRPDEETPGPFDGRAYALALASKRLLEAIGIWPHLAAEAQPINDIKVTDGRPGQGAAPWMLHFPSDDLGDEPMGFMIEDRHLRHAVRNVIAELDGIEVRIAERMAVM